MHFMPAAASYGGINIFRGKRCDRGIQARWTLNACGISDWSLKPVRDRNLSVSGRLALQSGALQLRRTGVFARPVAGSGLPAFLRYSLC